MDNLNCCVKSHLWSVWTRSCLLCPTISRRATKAFRFVTKANEKKEINLSVWSGAWLQPSFWSIDATHERLHARSEIVISWRSKNGCGDIEIFRGYREFNLCVIEAWGSKIGGDNYVIIVSYTASQNESFNFGSKIRVKHVDNSSFKKIKN